MKNLIVYATFFLSLTAAACAVPTDTPDGSEQSQDEVRAGDGTILTSEPRLIGCWLADGALRQTLSFASGPRTFVQTQSFAGDVSADSGEYSTRTAAHGFTILLTSHAAAATKTTLASSFANDTTLTVKQQPQASAPGELHSNLAYPNVTYLKQATDAACIPPAHRGPAPHAPSSLTGR